MKELVKIHQDQTVQGQPTANARELHTFLGVGRDFSNWIKGRIREYEFKEDFDYVIVFAQTGENTKGRPLLEYFISINMAKELGMVERTAKGREIRQYFIECERRLQGAPTEYTGLIAREQAAVELLASRLKARELLGVPEHLSQQESCKDVYRALNVDYRPMLKYAPAQDNIQPKEECLEVTEIGHRFETSGRKINSILEAIGWQVKTAKGWEPTEEGQAFAIRHTWSKGSKSGYNWKWLVEPVTVMVKDYLENRDNVTPIRPGEHDA